MNCSQTSKYKLPDKINDKYDEVSIRIFFGENPKGYYISFHHCTTRIVGDTGLICTEYGDLLDVNYSFRIRIDNSTRRNKKKQEKYENFVKKVGDLLAKHYYNQDKYELLYVLKQIGE